MAAVKRKSSIRAFGHGIVPQFFRLSRLLLSMAMHLGGLLAFVPSNSAQAVFPVKFSAEQL
jgi:hypothetical protein